MISTSHLSVLVLALGHIGGFPPYKGKANAWRSSCPLPSLLKITQELLSVASSMVKLAQCMTRNFRAGVCGTMHTWQLVQVGRVGEHLRLMIRNSMGSPGEPPGIVLSATSVSMPISPQSLFDFLRNEQLRSEWDELSHGGPMQEMVHIPKGQDCANCISLLHPSAADTNQNTMLVLQKMQTDASGSLIVYTAVEIPAMQVVMSGGDSATVICYSSRFCCVWQLQWHFGPRKSRRYWWLPADCGVPDIGRLLSYSQADNGVCRYCKQSRWLHDSEDQSCS